jgi:outer membrane lipoprotein SlyB
MRKALIAASTLALFALPTFASAQEGTAAGVATGAVTGAIVGGPVGAAVGAGVGGIAGGVAEQNAKSAAPNQVIVVPDASTTGTVRQQTCVQDAAGNRTCQEVVR